MTTTYTYKEAHRIISNAIKALKEAENSARSPEEQLAILDLLTPLRNELRRITNAKLEQSGDVYKAAIEDIRVAKEQLDGLSEEIKELIKAAEVAAKVAGALAKLVELAASVVVPG